MNLFYLHSSYPRIYASLCLLFMVGILTSCEQPFEGDELLTTAANPGASISQKKAPLITFSEGTSIDGQYIIVFKENAIGSAEMSRMAGNTIDRSDVKLSLEMKKKSDAAFRTEVEIVLGNCKIPESRITKTFSMNEFQGAVVNLDKKMLERVLADDKVASVEQDQFFAMNFVDPEIRSPMIPSGENLDKSQVVDYGVKRVGGSVRKMRGWSSWAWIVDTGIDLDHPDLKVNMGYSKNFVAVESLLDYSGNDMFGHGTHVAGIIGAIDNRRGIQGVAPGVQLVSVKVIDNLGIGTISDLIDGLSWVYAYGRPGDVVNLSLGGNVSESIDNAVKKIASRGIYVVIAAGNASKDASLVSPARVDYPNVFTISAIDENDNFCSFSNYGSTVDFAAPGSEILSTFIGGQYAYASGTSMAAPHAAGVLLVTNSPTYNGNAFGDPDRGLGDPIIGHKTKSF